MGAVLQFAVRVSERKPTAHGRTDGAQCANTGDSAAPSGTFRLTLNTKRIAPPGSRQNPNRRQANTQRETWESTASDPASAEVAPATVQRAVLRPRLA